MGAVRYLAGQDSLNISGTSSSGSGVMTCNGLGTGTPGPGMCGVSGINGTNGEISIPGEYSCRRLVLSASDKALFGLSAKKPLTRLLRRRSDVAARGTVRH